MPVTHCPHCRTELEIDADDFGYRVQCPSCQSAFTPEKDAAPAPMPPPPPPPPTPPPAETAADDDTKVVTCPECNGKVGVLDADLGHDMRCPLCDRVFTARLDDGGRRSSRRDDDDDGGSRRPWRSGSRGGSRSGDLPRYDDEKYNDRPRSRSDDDEDDRPRGRRRRRYEDDDDTPADLVRNAQRECAAPGVGLIIIACWGFLGGLLILVLYGMMLGGAFPRGGAGGQIDDAQIFLNIGLGVLQFIVSAFLLYAGMQMRQAKQYGMCMVACIICMVPYFSPCCLLGLIFGIMGIVKLNDVRVKKGFEANKPEYQGDGYN